MIGPCDDLRHIGRSEAIGEIFIGNDALRLRIVEEMPLSGGMDPVPLPRFQNRNRSRSPQSSQVAGEKGRPLHGDPVGLHRNAPPADQVPSGTDRHPSREIGDPADMPDHRIGRKADEIALPRPDRIGRRAAVSPIAEECGGEILPHQEPSLPTRSTIASADVQPLGLLKGDDPFHKSQFSVLPLSAGNSSKGPIELRATNEWLVYDEFYD